MGSIDVGDSVAAHRLSLVRLLHAEYLEANRKAREARKYANFAVALFVVLLVVTALLAIALDVLQSAPVAPTFAGDRSDSLGIGAPSQTEVSVNDEMDRLTAVADHHSMVVAAENELALLRQKFQYFNRELRLTAENLDRSSKSQNIFDKALRSAAEVSSRPSTSDAREGVFGLLEIETLSSILDENLRIVQAEHAEAVAAADVARRDVNEAEARLEAVHASAPSAKAPSIVGSVAQNRLTPLPNGAWSSFDKTVIRHVLIVIIFLEISLGCLCSFFRITEWRRCEYSAELIRVQKLIAEAASPELAARTATASGPKVNALDWPRPRPGAARATIDEINEDLERNGDPESRFVSM